MLLLGNSTFASSLEGSAQIKKLVASQIYWKLTLRVQEQIPLLGFEGSPNAQSAGALRGRSDENILLLAESSVEGVRFPIPRIPNDGERLEL